MADLNEAVVAAVEDAEEHGMGFYSVTHPSDPEEDIAVLVLTGYHASYGRETVYALWTLLNETVDTP